MINQQPIEKYEIHEGTKLEIVDLFHTIQGEGPFSGVPAVFVRTAGCTLQCPACDSDYTSNRRFMHANEVLSFAENHPNTKLLVLTGGEPLRQHLSGFVHWMLTRFTVQIETNGTLHQLMPGMRPFETQLEMHEDFVSIVCSPKTPSINSNLARYISAYKYILSYDNIDSDDGLPTTSLGMNGKPYRPKDLDVYRDNNRIFVQPCDPGGSDYFKNISVEYEKNIQACVESCMKYGYRLCLQTHKIVGLP